MADKAAVFTSDDTGAFGNNFITINLKNELNYPVSKVEFIINNGCILPKEYINPVFPLKINFDRTETVKFQPVNVCRLRAYDDKGLRKTCKNTLTFYAQNGEIINVKR